MTPQSQSTYDVEQAITAIIRANGVKPQALIMVLQDIQKHYNHLPIEALRSVANKMSLPIAQIYSVATFYKAFSLEPKGKHQICVCTGTSCHVRQSKVILDNLELILGVKPGETTKDGQISFETSSCLGACALGPVVSADGKYYGKMNAAKLGKLVEELKSAKAGAGEGN